MRMEMTIITKGVSIIITMEMAIKKIASTKTPSNNNSHRRTFYHTILATLRLGTNKNNLHPPIITITRNSYQRVKSDNNNNLINNN